MTATVIQEDLDSDRPVRRIHRQGSLTARHRRYRYVGADAEFRNVAALYHGEVYALGTKLIIPHDHLLGGRIFESTAPGIEAVRVRTAVRLNWRAAVVVFLAFLIQVSVVVQSAGIRAVAAASVPMLFAFFYVLLLDVRKRMAGNI